MRGLITLFIVLVVMGTAAYVWTHRVQLLARALGQPESRIRAQIERRKS